MKASISRIAALSVLSLLFLLAWFLVIIPLLSWQKTTLNEKAFLVRELTQLQASETRILNLIEAHTSVEDDQLFWRAEQQGEVSARIQSSLTTSAQQSGIAMRSIAPLRIVSEENVSTVGFRIEFESDLAQLTEFLRTIEAHSPVLQIKQATLRRLQRAQNLLPAIAVQLEVTAPVILRDEDT